VSFTLSSVDKLYSSYRPSIHIICLFLLIYSMSELLTFNVDVYILIGTGISISFPFVFNCFKQPMTMCITQNRTMREKKAKYTIISYSFSFGFFLTLMPLMYIYLFNSKEKKMHINVIILNNNCYYVLFVRSRQTNLILEYVHLFVRLFLYLRLLHHSLLLSIDNEHG